MASTVPAKSQPLHNFNLPCLKWNKDVDSSVHHHRRRSVKSPLPRTNPSSPSPLRQSPLRDYVSASSPHRQYPLRDAVSVSSISSSDNLVKRSPIRVGDPCKQSSASEWVKDSRLGTDSIKKFPIRGELMKQLHKRDIYGDSEVLGRNRSGLIEYKRNHWRIYSSGIKNEAHASTSGQFEDKLEKKQKVAELDEGKINNSKILIKIPHSNKQEDYNTLEKPQKIGNNDEYDEIDDIEEEGKMKCNDEETKTWNLRPRKPTSNSISANGSGMKVSGEILFDKNKAQSSSRNVPCRAGENEGKGGAGTEKKEKRKLSILIALSKDEIEEDIFSLTGSIPARRPKKRAKNIQKQVDFVFPGQWLVSITLESYKVSENYVKV